MRIAIVNDLALAREALRRLVVSVPGYSVAWTAVDGGEAVRRAAKDRPDVILMDLVMPVMDGVEATRQIMAATPCPILLVTSSVTGNFNMVYRAMGHGGLDAVNTPVLGPEGKVKDSEGLLNRLEKLEQANRLHGKPPSASTLSQSMSGQRSVNSTTASPAVPPLLVLGSSTGGPEALAQILSELPADCPAGVVVVQHIAADFAPSLVVWLQGRTKLRVSAAAAGSEPKPGHVLVAATNDHLVLERDRRLAYTAEPVELPYRPSVDVFFESVPAAWPRPGVAVLLTGMGSDGARGLLLLRKAGWQTIAQDQASSVVYGMPKAAAELNAACHILPLSRIAQTILAELSHAGGDRRR
jgi:two-component system response regulator WspF